MQQQLDARLHTNAEMMRAFLSAVVIVFEDSQLMKLQGTAEARARLQPAFYWGLSSSDEALRTRYFAVLESSFPQDIYQRLMCIMSKQNWQPMSQYFWIAHAARLLLNAALGKRGQQKTKTEEEGIGTLLSTLMFSIYLFSTSDKSSSSHKVRYFCHHAGENTREVDFRSALGV